MEPFDRLLDPRVDARRQTERAGGRQIGASEDTLHTALPQLAGEADGMVDAGIEKVQGFILGISGIIIDNGHIGTAVDLVPQEKQVANAGVAEADAEVADSLRVGEAGNERLRVGFDGRDDVVHSNREFEQLLRSGMAGEVEDDQGCRFVGLSEERLRVTNGSAGARANDGVGRLPEPCEVRHQLVAQLLGIFDECALPFPQFEERFLRPVAIDDQQGDPFFVVKDRGESLGQAAFADASLLRGEAQIDGIFGCVLRHIYKGIGCYLCEASTYRLT